MSNDMCPARPPGYFYRDDCSLLCRPAEWYDVVVFFLGNYAAHIATVMPQPGQSLASTILYPLLALLLPGSGSYRGLTAIRSMAVFAPTELQMAARAGALYFVVPVKRSGWAGEEELEQLQPQGDEEEGLPADEGEITIEEPDGAYIWSTGNP